MLQHLEDDLCRNLFHLLQTENLTLYAATLRVIFLMFEALRDKLKFQLERFITLLCQVTAPSTQHPAGCRMQQLFFFLRVHVRDCNM